jgi:two-component system, sensor histidine kinase and response regulator
VEPSAEEIDGALDPERFAELAHDLGPQDAEELVREFLHLTPASIAGLRAAAEADDAGAVVAGAHRLRGGCMSLGAAHLALACAAAEREAPAGGDLGAAVDAIDRAWQATRMALLRTLP